MKRKTCLLCVLIVLIAAVPALFSETPAEESRKVLKRGLEHYRAGEYDDAMLLFRGLTVDPEQRLVYPDAYFWIAKTYIAMDQYGQAQENLEFFLHNYSDHYYYPEGLYQRGRLHFLQEEYEACIEQSHRFIQEYEDSPFVANSYFWIAESLFALGHLEKAETIYGFIIKNFPRSYKIEAATYRKALIGQKFREEALLDLLKLSHEEYLKALEEFQKRERIYEKAVAGLQKRLSERSDGQVTISAAELTSLRESLLNRQREITELKSEEASLRDQLVRLRDEKSALQQRIDSVSSEGGEAAERVVISGSSSLTRLLQLQVRALKLKNGYVEELSSLAERN